MRTVFPIWHLNRADISVIKNNFLLKNVSVHSYHLPRPPSPLRKKNRKKNQLSRKRSLSYWFQNHMLVHSRNTAHLQMFYKALTAITLNCFWLLFTHLRNLRVGGLHCNKKQLWDRTRSGGKRRREESRLPHQLPWIKRFIKSVHWNWHGGTWAAEMKTPRCIFSHWWLDGGSAELCMAPPLLGGVGFRA